MVIQLGRNTKRKRQLHELLESRADTGIVLDEARWIVERERLENCEDDDARRSVYNSFARTVREQCPGFELQKLSISPETPIGLLARVAVFRIRDPVAQGRFVNAERACILCRYKTNLDVEEPHSAPASQYVVPHFHAVTFRFFEKRPFKIAYDQLENTVGTFIPATQKLTAIVPKGSMANIPVISSVPWMLFGYVDMDSWFEVTGTDPLNAVHRN